MAIFERFVMAATPRPLTQREAELEAQLQAAEARVIKAAVTLIKRANATETVRRIVQMAAEEVAVANGDHLGSVVPFWDELSKSTQFKVSKMLNGDTPPV